MKKKLFILIPLIFLTGCTTNYTLEITENGFNETIEGNVLKKELNQENQSDINMYSFLINGEQTVFIRNDNIYYNKTLIENKETIDYNYNYLYNENNFINSKILKTCFENFTYENKDNKYYLKAEGGFGCSYAPETIINIKTDYKVLANNANKINKNTYTWTINDTNKNNLDMFIIISKEKEKSNNWSTIKTISLIILLLLSALCIYLVKKKRY